jgi:Type IV secretion system pilin
MTIRSGCMKYNILFFVAFVCVFLPATTHAGDFVNLVGVPGLSGNPTGGGLNDYINALYRLSISIAALLAVIKIVIAGAKYMLSDIVTHKEDAKKDIQGALIGLLIVIGAIIILNTVNSDLTNLDLTIATTTVRQGPTIQEVLAERARAMEDRAADLGSRVVTGQCESTWGFNGFDMLPGETEAQACRRVCEGPTLRGQFIDNWPPYSDQCTYVEADGAQCIPNSNRTCCEGIHRGSWNADSQTCSGVAEGRNERRLECAQEMRVWNEQLGYCGAATCNLNTDANCCSARGMTIQNGICSATTNDVTTEQECTDRGAGWVYIAGTCRQQASGNTTQSLPSPRPADPYTYCFRIEPQGTWEFNESADICQSTTTN